MMAVGIFSFLGALKSPNPLFKSFSLSSGIINLSLPGTKEEGNKPIIVFLVIKKKKIISCYT
jgi:hypothetical protein